MIGDEIIDNARALEKRLARPEVNVANAGLLLSILRPRFTAPDPLARGCEIDDIQTLPIDTDRTEREKFVYAHDGRLDILDMIRGLEQDGLVVAEHGRWRATVAGVIWHETWRRQHKDARPRKLAFADFYALEHLWQTPSAEIQAAGEKLMGDSLITARGPGDYVLGRRSPMLMRPG